MLFRSKEKAVLDIKIKEVQQEMQLLLLKEQQTLKKGGWLQTSDLLDEFDQMNKLKMQLNDLMTDKKVLDIQYTKDHKQELDKQANDNKQLTDLILSDEEEIKKSSMTSYEIQIMELDKKKKKFLEDKVDALQVEQWYNDQLTKIHLQQQEDELKKMKELKQGASKFVPGIEGASSDMAKIKSDEESKWKIRLDKIGRAHV